MQHLRQNSLCKQLAAPRDPTSVFVVKMVLETVIGTFLQNQVFYKEQLYKVAFHHFWSITLKNTNERFQFQQDCSHELATLQENCYRKLYTEKLLLQVFFKVVGNQCKALVFQNISQRLLPSCVLSIQILCPLGRALHYVRFFQQVTIILF